ncbi:terminase gpA endonuclease subunit, partial [Escherichia coli]
WVDGRKKILWDSKKRRNEALDCFVYALAALRISISRWQLDLSALLASLQEEDGAATNKKTLADYGPQCGEQHHTVRWYGVEQA